MMASTTIKVTGGYAMVGHIKTLSGDATDGTLWLDDCDSSIVLSVVGGDPDGGPLVKVTNSVGVHIVEIVNDGGDAALEMDTCGAFQVDSVTTTFGDNPADILIDGCVSGKILAGYHGADHVAAVHVVDSTDITVGAGYQTEQAGYIHFENTIKGRFRGVVGSPTGPGVLISGTSDRCNVQGATITPHPNGTDSTYAVEDTSSGTNYAAGNDFGDVSLYTQSPAVTGVVVDWPADANYGDNFFS